MKKNYSRYQEWNFQILQKYLTSEISIENIPVIQIYLLQVLSPKIFNKLYHLKLNATDKLFFLQDLFLFTTKEQTKIINEMIKNQ